MFSSEGAGPSLQTIPELPFDGEAEGSPEMERIIRERDDAQRALRRCINMHYNRGGLLEKELLELNDFEGDSGAYWDPRWMDIKPSDVSAGPSVQYNTEGKAI
jgi:hypothetical protein